jgi:hypothetical protein
MSKTGKEKQFARDEVQLIVRRAAELQQRSSSDERIPAGASLAEIEALADRAGIDRAHVRAAAMELHRPTKASLGQLALGAPSRLRLSRVVPRAIAKGAIEQLMLDIQREMKDNGIVGLVGNTLTWSSSGQRPVRRSITVSAGDDCTTLTLEIQAGPVAGGLFGGIGGGVGGGAGVNALIWAILQHSPELGVLAAAILLGGYMLPRFIFKRVMAAQLRQGEALLDRLAEQVEQKPMREPAG